jgi:hypothetical protein
VDRTRLFWKNSWYNLHFQREKYDKVRKQRSEKYAKNLFGGNADGGHKLKPYLVYHSKNPRALKTQERLTFQIITNQVLRLWSQVLLEEWLINRFIAEVEKYCQENNIPFKILLIVDNEPGHPAHLDDFHPNVKIVFLYPKNTSLLQPTDHRVTARCKAYYRRRTLGGWLSSRVPSTGTIRIFAQNSTHAGSSGI